MRGVLRTTEAPTRTIAPAELWQADFPVAPDPEPEPEPVPDDPIPELAALRADWQADADARLQRAVEEARTEAYRQGYEAASAKLEASMIEEIRHHKVQAREMVRRLQALWLEGVRATEPLLARLAVDAAETVLALPLPESLREALGATLAQAVEELAAAGPTAVHLHPVDLLRLRESGLVEQLAEVHPALRWMPHPEYGEGEWQVEAPSGAVHFLRADLFDTLRRHLQVQEDASPVLLSDDELLQDVPLDAETFAPALPAEAESDTAADESADRSESPELQ